MDPVRAAASGAASQSISAPCLFDFVESRGGQHVRDFLGLPGSDQKPGWKGKLITDDFIGYKACFELGVTEVGCTAHARRKFHGLWVNHQSPVGEQALKYFGALYDVEREVADCDSEQRAKCDDDDHDQ